MMLLGRLAIVGGNPGAFVVAGDRFVDRPSCPEFLPVLKDSPGYDGAFYYRLALAPLDWTGRVAGIQLDSAWYRARRILYPLLGRVLGGGEPYRTAWALVLVNYVGVVALGWLAGGGRYAAVCPHGRVWHSRFTRDFS